MKKYKDIPEFLADLDADKREQVQLLRAIINDAHPGLSEHIRWNAPSYVLDGKDRVTFNLLNKENDVKLVLHLGATRKEDKKGTPILSDDTGLITWQSDIRGVVSFTSAADIAAKRADIMTLVSRWLALS